MTTVSNKDVKLAFSAVGLEGLSGSLLSKCTALANSLHLQPDKVAECWEAFSLNKGVSKLDDHCWQAFRNELGKESERNPFHNTPTEEKAVSTRKGMGKRQVGSPDAVGSALITPPTKRMATAQKKGNDKTDNSNQQMDVIAASDTTPTPSKATPDSIVSSMASSLTYTPPKYEERTGSGTCTLLFNPNDWAASISSKASVQPRCTISYNQFETNVQEPYRHLFTTLDDRAKALDRHLVDFEETLCQRYNIANNNIEGGAEGVMTDDNAIAPLASVGDPCQEMICNIGRICNVAHEGRINKTSVVLEGSKHLGGARIEVDLSHLQNEKEVDFSLFPGQIVAVEGMNPTGRKLTAHRICEGAAHGVNKSTARELLQFHHYEAQQNGQPLKIMSVAGPYTTSDNLNYDPLYDFMEQVMEEEPDVVIMVGPFVDMRHKDIQAGNAGLQLQDGESLTVPFEAIFANRISIILEDYFAAKQNSTQFVLVPSLDDATAEFVYPQAPFQDRVFGQAGKFLKITGASEVEVGTLGLERLTASIKKGEASYSRVHCVSNPCTFKINEIVIGVSGTDAVFHMSADETNANLVPGSRLTRIAQHMLQQRSYYPLFPAARGTNLDLKRIKKWSMPCQPDLLIVPSKLTSFARQVLDSTVVINPGQLTKNTTGGTFAIMNIHPMKREDLENAGGDDVELPHNVADRMRLEIKKI